MAFTYNSSVSRSQRAIFRLSGCVIASSILTTGLLITAPASPASVLVDPIIRSGASQVQPVSETNENITENIIDVTETTADFSTLSTALQAANLKSILTGDGPFTLFAPTNAAFTSLPPGALDTLLLPENRDLLVKVLYNHVGYGDFTADQLQAGSFETFDGSVDVEIMPTGITVDGANVIQADVEASNGVVHAVDKVLLPIGFVSQLEARMNSTSSTTAADSSSSEASTITRATTLQQGAIDRSVTTPALVAPPATPATAVAPEPQPAPVATPEPVRGLW